MKGIKVVNNKRVLAIITTPPPVHGSSIMNSYIYSSDLLRGFYDMDFLKYNFTKSVREIGKVNIFKILLFLKYVVILIYKLLFRRPHLIYFTIVPYGIAFYRDTILVFLIKLFNVKLVYHLHGKGVTKHYKKNALIYNFVFNNSPVICLSERLLNDVSFASGPFYIVPNGIEQICFEKKMNFNDIPNLLYLSNFVIEKGILQLLNAVRVVKSMGFLNFRLFLVGGYTEEINEKFLKDYILDNNLEDIVVLKGPLYDSDKEKILRMSDVFCFPTYYKNETFGLVNLEAMQFSLPIVTSYEGGIPDIVEHGHTGFLVDPFDENKMAEILIRLISDKPARIQMGANAFDRFVSHYTVQIFEQNILDTFKKILDE